MLVLFLELSQHLIQRNTCQALPKKYRKEIMSTLKKIKTLTDLDISIEMIQEQILKTIYVQGAIIGAEISEVLKVKFTLIENELVSLKKRDLLGVVGSNAGIGGYVSMKFDLTPKGRVRAKEIFDVRSYVGPIPVTMEEYKNVITKKKIVTRGININKIQNVFKSMTLAKGYFEKVGPAINSGGPILFYGKPGNGKTMIAEKIIDAFGDYIYVPHCLYVDGQFIKYFDEKVHKPISYETSDPRWIKVERPFIVVGGELTLAMLDLVYKDEFKYYEAPVQLKANGGVLLVDDFGRQLLSPQELLNRWIYPLEKNIDYLTLVTGKKIEVPFDQMLVFSSNLEPNDLGDDAFLRRIKYKIEVTSPTLKEFTLIFKKQCEAFELSYNESAFNYLVNTLYKRDGLDFRGCHSRDLLAHVQDFNSFYDKKNTLTKENIDFAWNSYFSGKKAA